MRYLFPPLAFRLFPVIAIASGLSELPLQLWLFITGVNDNDAGAGQRNVKGNPREKTIRRSRHHYGLPTLLRRAFHRTTPGEKGFTFCATGENTAGTLSASRSCGACRRRRAARDVHVRYR
jgi:hypothetical protein